MARVPRILPLLRRIPKRTYNAILPSLTIFRVFGEQHRGPFWLNLDGKLDKTEYHICISLTFCQVIIQKTLDLMLAF